MSTSERELLLNSPTDRPVHRRKALIRHTSHDEGREFSVEHTEKHSVLFCIFAGSLLLIISTFVVAYSRPQYLASRVTMRAFRQGRLECARIDAGFVSPPLNRTLNPRFDIPSLHEETAPPNAILLTNVTLLDGDGSIKGGMSIFMLNGMIHAVSNKPMLITNLAMQTGVLVDQIVVVNLANHYVTPGLVDMHSHAGTDSWPALVATDDTNEMTSTPTTPFIRAIDGFNPQDPAIRIINAGGVTSSLILPGSGNLIGGEALMIKHRVAMSSRIQDMLIYANANLTTDGRLWRHMKMACGENAKAVYGPRGMMPGSRLGEGFLFREQFSAAKVLKEQQDDWCALANNAHKHAGSKAHTVMHHIFPVDIKFDSLVGLLRGEVRLQNHCYETEDLEMMIRHSHEFGYKINTFHHALEAFKVAELLAKENISTAIFADLFGYKKEAYGASTHAAQVLTDAGVKVAFKSDHPVLNAQAQKAHHYRFEGASAIRAVTSIPAENMGVSHRIGFIRPGYDADLVVWSEHPLSLGSTPLRVYVDGHTTFTHGAYASSLSNAFANKQEDEVATVQLHVVPDIVCCDSFDGLVALTNISAIYASTKHTLNNTMAPLIIVIDKGIVSCFGSDCTLPPSIKSINLNGGVVLPGLVLGATHLGLEEISAEEVTKDGTSSGFEKTGGARAADGLSLGLDGSLLLTSAFKAGIISAIASPRGSGVLLGQAASFRIGEDDLSKAVIDEVTGVSVVIGNSAKSKGESSSISGQIALLRSLLKDSATRIYHDKKAVDSVFDQVVLGKKTLLVHADSSNAIQHAVQVKREIQNLIYTMHKREVQIRMTVIGGAEAWKIASLLSNESVGVMLVPARCAPGKWETRGCILPNGIGIGQEYLNDDIQIESGYPSAHVLTRAGVIVGLGFEEDNFARGLIWEAGWVYKDSTRAASVLGGSGLSESEVIGMVTWNVAKIMGADESLGSIRVGDQASLVAYSVDPIRGHRGEGGLSSYVKLVQSGVKGLCNSRQY